MSTYSKMLGELQAKADGRMSREAALQKCCADIVARLTGILAASPSVIDFGFKDSNGDFQSGKVTLKGAAAAFLIVVTFSINGAQKILSIPIQVRVHQSFYELSFDVYANRVQHSPTLDNLALDLISDNISRVIEKEFPKLLAQSFV